MLQNLLQGSPLCRKFIEYCFAMVVFCQAAGELTGARPPEGIEASMALTNPNDLKVPETRTNHRVFLSKNDPEVPGKIRCPLCLEVAFEMLDVNKEGVLGKKQAPTTWKCIIFRNQTEPS